MGVGVPGTEGWEYQGEAVAQYLGYDVRERLENVKNVGGWST